MENKIFYLTNEDGTKSECELLFTFELTSTGKHYIVFTEGEADFFGNLPVSVYGFDPTVKDVRLECVESDYVLAMAQYMLENKMQVKYN